MDIYERLREEKQIVAFSGKKRVGKDTAASAIAAHGYFPIAFADPIKETCQIVFEFDDDQIYGSKKSEVDPFWDFSPRWAMQTIGTEMFREHIDGDVWVKSLLARIDESDQDKFAVTDVRFPNEVEHLQRAGAEMIHIRRPSVEPELHPFKKWIAKQGGLLKKVASAFTDFGSEYHASEISLDGHPTTRSADIVNNGTVEDFRETVRFYVQKVEEGDQHFTRQAQLLADSIDDQGMRKVHGAKLKS